MLSLKQILLEMEGDGETFVFPNDNFTLAVFPSKKTMMFTPQYHTSITEKIRTLVNMLKEKFRILRVVDKDLGSFEVQVDPREDFQAVVNFITNPSEEPL